MGFRIERRKCRLEFDPEQFPEYAGAEIVCRLDINTEAFLDLERLQASIGGDEAPDGEKVRAMLGFFAENIVESWNLEDESGPLPLDLASLMQLPPKLTLNLIPLWKAAAVGIDAPLGQPSPDGELGEGPLTQQENS